MSRLGLPALALAAGIGAGALLGGCGGSSTKTVSVAGAPPASTQTASTTTATTKQPSTPTTTAATGPPSTTRTATEPAFSAKEETASGAAGAAAAAVRAQGYTPSDTSLYHANQTLRVLIGRRTGSGDGHEQRAFFFVGERYIGTDASAPSASLQVLSQSDTAVTLAYPLYRHGDPLCCPGGGQASVRFELNNGKLVPVGTIPPVSSAGGLSRQ